MVLSSPNFGIYLVIDIKLYSVFFILLYFIICIFTMITSSCRHPPKNYLHLHLSSSYILFTCPSMYSTQFEFNWLILYRSTIPLLNTFSIHNNLSSLFKVWCSLSELVKHNQHYPFYLSKSILALYHYRYGKIYLDYWNEFLSLLHNTLTAEAIGKI